MQKEPNCDTALVHDDDLGCLRDSVRLFVNQIGRPLHVFSRLNPSILIHLWIISEALSRGYVVVSIWLVFTSRIALGAYKDDEDSSKAGTHVRVAMLAELAFNTSYIIHAC